MFLLSFSLFAFTTNETQVSATSSDTISILANANEDSLGTYMWLEYAIAPSYTKMKVVKAEIPWGTGVANAKQVIKFLEKNGFIKLSQKGSHVKLKGPNGNITIVPNHGNKDIPKGTLNSILKQAGFKKKK
jgi:predicted RNA binding protein YcfA (HicA-like mRNA interferase family)